MSKVIYSDYKGITISPTDKIHIYTHSFLFYLNIIKSINELHNCESINDELHNFFTYRFTCEFEKIGKIEKEVTCIFSTIF